MRERQEMSRRRKRGSIFVWIQLIITGIVIGVLYISEMMPINYLVIISAILMIFFFFSWGMCRTRRSRPAGRILAILVSLVLGVSAFYLIKTQSVLERITGSNTKTDEISVVVLETDPAQSLEDASGYVFGIVSAVDGDNTKKAVKDIESILNKTLITTSCATYSDAAEALLRGQVGAILFNEAYREMIEEMYPGFGEQTKVLHVLTIKTKIDIFGSDKNIAQECFTVYISGIDVYGDISKTSRSDVNIIAAVNPNTKQILLISTPRDYYVQLASNGEYDKLTHAGLYGIDESMHTLENLYGISLDYHVRVNFTGFVDIINILGGITVDSDYAFTSVDGKSYQQGLNDLNGEQALSFARERKAFSDGDIQRGKNQMKVIRAIIQKAVSPTILGSYSSLLDQMDGCFETSISSSSISDLVKMQLSDGGDWNVITYTTIGTPDYRNTYSYGAQPLSVVLPDENAVQMAKLKLQQLFGGEILTQEP